MRKTTAAIIIAVALLAGCASPAPAPGPTATPLQVALEPTATRPPTPTSTVIPSPTPTMSPVSESCVRATTEIPEGQNPTRFMTSGPASGCYEGVGDFLDDVGLTWEEFAPGTVITFWTRWPVDGDGRVVYPTPTSVPTYTLSGTVFFDYNGNGLRDEGEPPIECVPIRVAGLTTTTAQDGSYSLAGVPAGSQQVYVRSPSQEPVTAFRYISLSLEACHPIDEPITLMVSDGTSLQIALMEGFLTLPFKGGTVFELFSYLDLDPRPGEQVRNYRGETLVARGSPLGEHHCGTAPDHDGIDYIMSEGWDIVAAAPGSVTAVGNITGCRGALAVRVDHLDGLATLYDHLSYISVQTGQTVRRGETIGRSGSTGVCSGGPHLHFGVLRGQRVVDPYRDELDPDGSLGYFTKDNDPQFCQ